tara:strand:- start:267 stop:440 length:174 start_codon:yes stop_codon:yes gene_type:complete
MNEQDEDDYNNGYLARSKGMQKNACPFGARRIRRRMAWLGGWNDKDIEYGTKGENYE